MIKPLFQNVVIAVNGSDGALKAAKYGILMAKLYRCNLKAVYVADTATLKQLTLTKIFIPEESRQYAKDLDSDGERYLNYVRELAKAKGVNCQTELRHGSVWSEIIRAAEDFKADVILLGGKENDGGRLDVLSSSYRDIVNHSSCSVLVVREKYIDQMFKLG